MPSTTVIANDGDTLCGLAIAAGFLDCQPLRDEAANAGLLDRDLVAGDVVTIPELQAKEESKGTGATHAFVVENAPPIQIRFVHGSKSTPYRQDDTTTFLNVSNFVTNRGGANGRQTFPTATVFNEIGHADPDAFKVEVVDPAGPGTVKVKLEAMKPIYGPDGKTILRHEPFGDATRELQADCKKVPSGVCYRSPYLRLVVDADDKNGLPNQTLLMTDMADGLNGDNDRLEILDQLVRASYVRTKCPGGTKCTVRATVPLAPDKQRIKVAVHLFRDAAGTGTVATNGITEQMVRLRLFGIFRRTYAQAGLSPRLVEPPKFLNPPRARMLAISELHGRAATGTPVGGNPAAITFRLVPAPGTPAFPGGIGEPTVTVPLTPGMSPAAAGAAVVAALPAGFKGEAFTNARATNAADASCDVLITRDDGDARDVVIRGEQAVDATMTVLVPRVASLIVNIDAGSDGVVVHHAELRRIVRESPGKDDRLDFYCVDQLVDGTGALAAVGVAMIPGSDLPAGGFAAVDPLRWGALMGSDGLGGHSLDAAASSPTAFPHEAGHVLGDTFHPQDTDPNARAQMMWGGSEDEVSMATGTKRMHDDPVRVSYAVFDSRPAVQTATPGRAAFERVNVAQRIRTRGAQVYEAW